MEYVIPLVSKHMVIIGGSCIVVIKGATVLPCVCMYKQCYVVGLFVCVSVSVSIDLYGSSSKSHHP